MTELVILTAFAPLVFLPFPAFRRLTQVWGWTAIAIAGLCNGYFIFLHYTEPLLWIPAGVFLSVFAVNLVGQRYRRGLSSLSVLFVSQALLTKNLGHIIVLLSLADTFLGVELFLSSKVEEKNRAVQSLYQSAVSLLPATLGLLLRLDGSSLISCVAATVVLRLFSWPVSHWIVEISGENKMFPTYIGIVSSFALWHIQDFLWPDVWALTWLSLGALFSLGCRYTEMYACLSMGIFSLSPGLGVLAVAFWPLLARPTYSVYAVGLLTAAMGVLLSDNLPKALLPEATYVIGAVAAIALARVFVGTAASKTKWYLVSLDVFFSLLWSGLLLYLIPPAAPSVSVVGAVFGGTFLFIWLVGKLIHNKKPKLFSPLPGLSPHVFSRDILGSDILAEKKGAPIEMGQSRARKWICDALESEAYIAFLFGVLGAILIWELH